MAETHSDDRARWAVAYQRASRAVSVAITMVAPVAVGAVVDRLLATRGIFTLVGAAMGLTSGIMQLVAFGKSAAPAAATGPAVGTGSENGTTPDVTAGSREVGDLSEAGDDTQAEDRRPEDRRPEDRRPEFGDRNQSD